MLAALYFFCGLALADEFKIGPEAQATLGVKFSRFDGKVPAPAVVKIQERSGVYRRSPDGQIRFVPIEELKGGDEIAVAGTLFLRMIEADLESGSSEGHSH